MKTSALYGILFGMAMMTADALGPYTWRLYWVVVGCQLAVGATLVWFRTPLRLWSFGTALAASASLGFALFTTGKEEFGDLLLAHPLLLAGMLVAPALLLLEKRAHPEEWHRLRARADQCGLADMLAFRHIPDLRTRT